MKRSPYPLQWPPGRSRTKPADRRNSQFGGREPLTPYEAAKSLLAEVKRLGASHAVITSMLPTRHDGLPYSDGRTDDPGVAVWMVHRGHERVFACDRWRTPGENLRPWFHDCRTFADWSAGRPFDGVRWMRDQWRIRNRGLTPDFVVVPDIVAGGESSLDLSARERPYVADDRPAYLVVQDGMKPARISRWLDEQPDPYAGLFVGGTLDWKLATAATWVDLAHARGMRCHIGRVGPPDRVRWALDIAADSIDSSLPLRDRGKLVAFLRALGHDLPVRSVA